MAGLCTAVLAMSLAVGAADNPLSEFGELVVGNWIGDASLIDRVPDGIGREKVAAQVTYRWVSHAKVLEGNWQRGDVSGKWLLIWNPLEKVIKSTGGRSDGNAWQGVIVKKGNEWIEETEGTLGDGSKVTSRFVTLFQNGGTRIVWEGEFSIDGKKPEPIRDVYEKVGANTLLQEFGEQFAGRWIGDVTLVHDWPGIGKRGEKVVAYWNVRWTADRNALLCDWQGGQGGGTSLFAWNPAAKYIMDLTARTDGVTGLATITKEGNKWISRAKGGLPDGTEGSHEIAFEFEDNGKVMRVSGDVVLNGKKVDALNDVYRRLDN